MAIDRQKGTLVWKTEVDKFESSQITGSPIVYKNVVYVGVSSAEESRAEDPSYACCVFRGSVVALDENTGNILWQTYIVPPKPVGYSGVWYSGGAVWSPAVVDDRRNSLLVTTGNNYSVPAPVQACQQIQDRGCTQDPQNYIDAVVALDLGGGTVKWANRAQGIPGNPDAVGPDARTKIGPVVSDFGETHRAHLVGESLVTANGSSSPVVRLRMGRGGITVKTLPAEGYTAEQ